MKIELTEEEADTLSTVLDAVIAFGHGVLLLTPDIDAQLERVFTKLGRKRRWSVGSD